MEEFQEFIKLMGLVISCVRGKFSWFKYHRKSMYRIDIFLVTRKLKEEWGVIDQRVGSRYIYWIMLLFS